MSSVSRPASEIDICCYPRCRAKVYDDPAAPPFCGTHMVECASFIAAKMDLFLLDSSYERRKREEPLPSWVYYARLGDHVKIGVTLNVQKRMASFLTSHPADAVELLATELGGGGLERERHAQFAAERINPRRELFNPSPRLLAFIDNLREQAA